MTRTPRKPPPPPTPGGEYVGMPPQTICRCGHVPMMCHRINAEKWCGGTSDASVAQMRGALRTLHQFGERLMNSEVMEERGIGCCICESTRVLFENPFGVSPA